MRLPVLWRRHDGYVLRSFLGAFGFALLFLTTLFVLWDLADRIAKIESSSRRIRAAGGTPWLVILEYYATLVPFIWLRILPLAALLAGSMCIVWLCRQNEMQPLLCAGVPVRRVLRPVFLAGVVLAGAQVAVREWVVPSLARRNDELQRLISERKPDRIQKAKHVHDALGGRLSVAAYLPAERRMEGAWITFPKGGPEDGRPCAYRFPSLIWDEGMRAWGADRGGERILLDVESTGAITIQVPSGTAAPLRVDPALLELTLRQSAALALSSAEIQSLARANPGNARVELALQQQYSGPVSTIVLLLIGLPFAVRLGRRDTSRGVLRAIGLVALFHFVDAVAADLGGRGTLQPVAAAWLATAVFGALGVALFAGVDS